MFSSVLLLIGLFLGAIMVLNSTKDEFGAVLLGATGTILIAFCVFLQGVGTLMNTKFGVPIKVGDIKHFHELRLEKRLNPSLSLVRENHGDDRRVVKDIPAHVREGDVFMTKEDGSVVIIKSPPKH